MPSPARYPASFPADSRVLEEIRRLRTEANREIEGLQAFRKWNGGEFKTQFETVDREKIALDGFSEASDLERAQTAATKIHFAAQWIADKAAISEELDSLERDIDALSPELEETEAERYAQTPLYRAKTARTEARRRRDRSDFDGAKEKLGEARELYENALAAARTARAAAKAREELVKTEAEKKLAPVWVVTATLGGIEVQGARLVLGGRTYTLPVRISLEGGKTYGPGEVMLEKGGKTYVGTLAKTTADWKGAKPGSVALSERPEHSDILPVRVGGVLFNLRWCPPGTISMGSPISEGGHDTTERQRSVPLERGFWMGETEVTQGLWKEVMGGNPSGNQSGADYPVENVSWKECKEFVEKLNGRPEVKAAGLRFAMPTEAQWEYACRAGSKGRWGNVEGGHEGTLAAMGWYAGNSGKKTHPVGQQTANAWGLHDMHGNVWEWCADLYQKQSDGTLDNDAAMRSMRGDRVLRGGSATAVLERCRSAYRFGFSPDSQREVFGFRLLAFQPGR